MAKLTAKARSKLPLTTFGMPSKRAYPMPDKFHAIDAKARAAQMVKKGKLSKFAQAKIDAKASRKIKGK